MIDELGGPKTYNHYPNGWAMAFNTPFKMWKRYEFNGGTSDPCIIAWPPGIKARRRDPPPVPSRHRPRAHHPRRARTSKPPDAIKGSRPVPVRRREHALQLRRPGGAVREEDPVLLDARLAGDLARRLEGGHHPPDDQPAGATSTTTPGSSTTPRSTGPSCTTWPAEQPDKAARDGEPVVRRGRGERRLPARRPGAARDLHHAPAAADSAPRDRYVYYPGTARRPRAAGR